MERKGLGHPDTICDHLSEELSRSLSKHYLEQFGQVLHNNVSLLVLPEEAEILALASDLGSLALTLRSDEDVDPVENRGHATIQTLLSGERAKTLQERRQQTIQIIRGTAEKNAIAGGRER